MDVGSDGNSLLINTNLQPKEALTDIAVNQGSKDAILSCNPNQSIQKIEEQKDPTANEYESFENYVSVPEENVDPLPEEVDLSPPKGKFNEAIRQTVSVNSLTAALEISYIEFSRLLEESNKIDSDLSAAEENRIIEDFQPFRNGSYSGDYHLEMPSLNAPDPNLSSGNDSAWQAIYIFILLSIFMFIFILLGSA